MYERNSKVYITAYMMINSYDNTTQTTAIYCIGGRP